MPAPGSDLQAPGQVNRLGQRRRPEDTDGRECEPKCSLPSPPAYASGHLPHSAAGAFVVPASASGFSISDAGLESWVITLHRSISGLNIEHLNTIFLAVGFPDPEKITVALNHSGEEGPEACGLCKGNGGTDGVFNAIIWDVVVDPWFLGMEGRDGERLIDDLVEREISNIVRYSEPRVLGFYRQLASVAEPDRIPGYK
ncbi:hypothetical protein SAY86_025022 [Trapa natans]|uniref:Uncharacterized protein n=1 Tax=Trapa natans TaxID=22666 RepID=A0AAN7MI94_TRANT|nr:hypothetical protein SAY86_025022 [Trapa natans]